MESDDRELMLRVRDGDLDAFEQLVLRHQKQAWRTAYRCLGDRTEAEDLVQDAFLKILNAAPRYRPSAQFTTYLYRVIVNLSLDRHRKKRPLYFGQMPPQQTRDDGPENQYLFEECDQMIQQALNELPATQRMATVLRYYEELSLTNIAEVMDMTYKAVERLLARARKSMKTNLGDFLK